MATTNIQIFNKNQNNALPDNEYTNCTERNNGFLGVLARANVFNKFCYQVSLVCKSIADFMVNKGFNANDSVASTFTTNFEKAIVSVIANEINSRVPNTRAKETYYKKGDIATDASLPLWGELECITAGTTSNSDFSSILEPYKDSNTQKIENIGLQIQDGSVLWVLRAKRFSSPLNTPIPFIGQFLEVVTGFNSKYYVPIHSEIGLPMLDYRFCDGQNIAGYSTINMTNRFLMCKNLVSDNNSVAGSDEISIAKNNLPTGNFGLSLTCADWNKTLSGSFTTGNETANHSHAENTYGAEAQGYPLAGGISVQARGTEGGRNTAGVSNNHQHKVTVSFNATHKHSVSGNVVLNSSNQQKISVVSRHYKLAFIQRIY